MLESLRSRRRVLSQLTGIGLLSGLAGCTMLGSVDVSISIENSGSQKEHTEYYIDRNGNRSEIKTIDLDSGENHTISVPMELGDALVISKGELGFRCELSKYLCRDPSIQVDIGAGMLSVSNNCFYVSEPGGNSTNNSE